MDPQTAMETAGEVSKAVTKFQEILQKIFNPHWTKKQADADAYADERKLQTIRDNPDMDIVYRDGALNARKRTPEALAYRAEQRVLAESIRQEANLENVLEVAANEVSQMSDVSDKLVDEDWLARLFQIVKDVSSEEMQLVWGKILAGEIKEPGNFSFRTLETVRNLSQSDAEMFQKIIPLVIAHGSSKCILSDTKTLTKYNVALSDVLILAECGLINLESLVLQLYVTNTMKSLIYTDSRLLLVAGSDEKEKKVTFGVYPLTKVGGELYNILSHSPNEQYIFDVADQIIKNNKEKNPIVTIHEVNSIDAGSINYKTEPIKKFTV